MLNAACLAMAPTISNPYKNVQAAMAKRKQDAIESVARESSRVSHSPRRENNKDTAPSPRGAPANQLLSSPAKASSGKFVEAQQRLAFLEEEVRQERHHRVALLEQLQQLKRTSNQLLASS